MIVIDLVGYHFSRGQEFNNNFLNWIHNTYLLRAQKVDRSNGWHCILYRKIE